jgi:hypothetical protein
VVKRRKVFLCRDCASRRHRLEYPTEYPPPLPPYVLIDGVKYREWIKDWKVRCSECGVRVNRVYEPYEQKKWGF